MPRPPQFRDLPLLWILPLAAVALMLVSSTGQRYRTVEITLARSCASSDSCPVADALAALHATADLRRHTQDGYDVVSLQAPSTLSADRIWSAVEAASCRPILMLVGRREYKFSRND